MMIFSLYFEKKNVTIFLREKNREKVLGKEIGKTGARVRVGAYRVSMTYDMFFYTFYKRNYYTSRRQLLHLSTPTITPLDATITPLDDQTLFLLHFEGKV